jgi:transcriptional regulator with XRE-family HTH domain
MMKHKAYVSEQRRNPTYQEAEQALASALDLAADVIRLRMQRGWTQEELAERMGTYQANISRLEHGLANPTLETLQKLSEVFKVDLCLRLGGEQYAAQEPNYVRES